MENKIGVLPHRRALVTDLPDFVLLYGLGEYQSKYFQNVSGVTGVNMIAEGVNGDKQAGKDTPNVQSKRSQKKAKRHEKKAFELLKKSEKCHLKFA